MGRVEGRGGVKCCIRPKPSGQGLAAELGPESVNEDNRDCPYRTTDIFHFHNPIQESNRIA